MLEYQEIDILDCEADVFLTLANWRGQTKGTSKRIKKRFPWSYTQHMEYAKKKKDKRESGQLGVSFISFGPKDKPIISS